MAFKDSSSHLRVLLVCAVNGHGGPIQSLATVVRYLPESVHTTLATQISAPPACGSSLERVVMNTLPIPRPRGAHLLRAQWNLVRRVRWMRRSVDVIHANGLTEAVVALPAAVLARTPVVVWIHNYERPRPFRVAEPLLRVLGRRWHWLAVSALAAEQVHYAVADLVENPVDIGAESDLDGNDENAAMPSNRGAFRVVYMAGSDRPYKGFDLLPSMIASARARDIEWHIYTSPPYSSPDPRCRDSWDLLLGDLSDKVRIHGRVDHIAEVYRNADLIIAPSRQESFNRVIAEAISFGTPVVASDIAPHRAMIESTGAGELFPLDDPAQAAAVIDRLHADARAVAELRAAARRSGGRFAPEMITSEVLAAWTAAAQTKGRPRP